MRSLVKSVVLLFFVVQSATAQQQNPLISVTEVKFELPLIVPSYHTNNLFYDSAYDHVNNIIYIHTDNELYKTSLSALEWEFVSNLDVPLDVDKIGYSEYHNSLFTWDKGVGRVYQIDSLGVAKRVDNSFEHRNQYGHISWIDRQTGKIFALGGYGLFTGKQILSKYSPTAREWDLHPILNQIDGPSDKLSRYAIFDRKKEELYLISSTESHYESLKSTNTTTDGYAIWRLELKSSKWTKLRDLGVIHDISTYQPHLKSTTISSINSEFGYLLFLAPNPNNQIDVFAFDTNSHHVLDITNSISRALNGLRIFNLMWSDVDQVFYALAVQALDTSSEMQFRLFKIEISDHEEFVRLINESEATKFSEMVPLLALVLLLIPGALWMRKRRNGHEKSALEADEKTFNGILVERLSTGGFKLSCNGFETSDIPPMEAKLLDLLVNELNNPGSYVKSDDIDVLLLPDHPSPDYIRRTRNLTLERLEALLQSVCELENDQKYILRRSNISDKRKNEYRFNSEAIQQYNS